MKDSLHKTFFENEKKASIWKYIIVKSYEAEISETEPEMSPMTGHLTKRCSSVGFCWFPGKGREVRGVYNLIKNVRFKKLFFFSFDINVSYKI